MEVMIGSETLNTNPFSYDRPFHILLDYGCFSLSMEQLGHCDILTFIQFFSYIKRSFILTANSLAFNQFRLYVLLPFDYKLIEVKSIETLKIKPFSSVKNQTLYCIQT